MSDYLNSLTYLESPLDMEILSPYKNLIYVRLDMPEVPDFDQELFKDWCRNNYKDVVNLYNTLNTYESSTLNVYEGIIKTKKLI